jgi:hypothetical protein
MFATRTAAIVSERLGRKTIQLSAGRILFDVAIACGAIALGEPLAKLGEFVRGQSGHRLFDCLEATPVNCQEGVCDIPRITVHTLDGQRSAQARPLAGVACYDELNALR